MEYAPENSSVHALNDPRALLAGIDGLAEAAFLACKASFSR